MHKSFYLRLALANARRNRQVYVPYAFATAIISGVYFLILAMIFSPGLSNLPGGDTAKAMFTAGIVVFTLFAYFFMLYVNAFLVKRRKKEFGLYSVLGMNRKQIARIVVCENLLVVSAGVFMGVALGSVLGRLLFLVLLHIMRAAVAGSLFILPLEAFWGTAALFLVAFVSTAIYNSVSIHIANTAELLKSDRQSEKRPGPVLPGALLGLVLLLGAYAAALLIKNMGMALMLFFPAAFIVILATYLLFGAGCMAFLQLLRKNKRLYYKPGNFIAISSMFHRMRQNARGLATICVLSTMLIVTVAGSSSLYLGQEEILRANYPYDIRIHINPVEGGEMPDTARIDALIGQLAARNNVAADGPKDKLLFTQDREEEHPGFILVPEDSVVEELRHALLLNHTLMLNAAGTQDDAVRFAAALNEALAQDFPEATFTMRTIYEARTDGYGIFGGLLFLGAFFGVLFLALTVLMIYFKQVTEGQEDKDRFEILQKVGMSDSDVRFTINRQILWIFFLPLAGALAHTLAASPMIATMLEAFKLYNHALTVRCVLATSAVFALTYLLVYRQTASVYYRLVRR
ncbi:MAG: ABC transporter permease [Candidatus Pelethousia sp.]|nr:ABC transporter permease [Candidatus Pelethousia sp.]